MKTIICAACRTILGYTKSIDEAKQLALDHTANCTSTKEQYEQAVVDIKFQQITQGLEL